MSDLNKTKFNLRLEATPKSEWVNVSVLDGDNRLIAQQTGSFSLDLPKGLYTVVSELSGNTTTQIIKHTADDVIEIQSPEMDETIDLDDYGAVIARESQRTTAKFPDFVSEDNTLFLFIYTSNRQGKQEKLPSDPFSDFYLIQGDKIVAEINAKDCNVNQEEGWATFSCGLPVGMYELQYRNKVGRSIFVEIYDRKHSQVFLEWDNAHSFDSLRMAISPFQGFDDQQKSHTSFTMALEKIRKRDFNVSETILQELAHAEWVSPMYGIVVAYIYLLGDSRRFEDLFHELAYNLPNRILYGAAESPDLRMIQILMLVHDKGLEEASSELEQMPGFDYPPTFRLGLEKLYALSNTFPNLIPEGSLTERIAESLCYDTIWTSYGISIQTKKTQKKSDKPKKSKGSDFFERMNSTKIDWSEVNEVGNALYEAESAYKSRGFELNKPAVVKIEIKKSDDFIPILADIINGFIKRNKSTKQLTIRELAKELNLPTVTVKRKIKELQQEIALNKTGKSVVRLKKLLKTNSTEALIEMIKGL